LEEPPLVVGRAWTTTAWGRASSTPLTSEAPADKRRWRMRGRGAREMTMNEETIQNDETTIDKETTNDKTTTRWRRWDDDNKDDNKMTTTIRHRQQDDDKMTSGVR
jgi:hypothetical protein